jgi:mannose-6-phosphate isomerase-like protein (cupin superfamily)
MRKFDSSSAQSTTNGPVDVARWEQYGLGSTMPFDAMWYSVMAGQSSARDCHPELELSIVISGTASVEVGGTITDMPVGSAFLFDSEEGHIIHNRQDVPVTIFSAYWMPVDAPGTDPVLATSAAAPGEPADG